MNPKLNQNLEVSASRFDNSGQEFEHIEKFNKSEDVLKSGLIVGAGSRSFMEQTRKKGAITKSGARKTDDKACCNNDGCFIY